MKNQKGFTLVEILLVVIALAVITGVGFYIANASDDKKPKASTTSAQKTEPKSIPRTLQVTAAQADEACQAFFDRVKSDITSVSGYTILKTDKSCTPDQDEAGFTDYAFGAFFQVAKVGSDSAEGMKANLNYLVKHFPNKDYSFDIYNAPPKNGQSATICLDADQDIQESGEAFNQEDPPQHRSKYVEPGTYDSTCADL